MFIRQTVSQPLNNFIYLVTGTIWEIRILISEKNPDVGDVRRSDWW